MRFNILAALVLVTGCSRPCDVITETDTVDTSTDTSDTETENCTFTEGITPVSGGQLGNEIDLTVTGLGQFTTSNQMELVTASAQSVHENCDPVVLSGIMVEFNFTDPTGSEWWRQMLNGSFWIMDQDGWALMEGDLAGFDQTNGVFYEYFQGAIWIDPGATRGFKIIADPSIMQPGDTIQANILPGILAQSSAGTVSLQNDEISGNTLTRQ